MPIFNLMYGLLPTYHFGFDNKIKSLDDTFIDKLNYRYSVFLILACAFLLTHIQTNGAQANIHCLAPPYFTRNNADYLNEYCYLMLHVYNNTNNYKYYHFIPYFLIFLSIIVYLPRFIYTQLLAFINIDLNNWMYSIKLFNNNSNNDKLINYLIDNFNFYLKQSRNNLLTRLSFTKSLFIIKLLYSFNNLIVIYLLSKFNHNNYYMYDLFNDSQYINEFLNRNIVVQKLPINKDNSIYFPLVS